MNTGQWMGMLRDKPTNLFDGIKGSAMEIAKEQVRRVQAFDNDPKNWTKSENAGKKFAVDKELSIVKDKLEGVKFK